MVLILLKKSVRELIQTRDDNQTQLRNIEKRKSGESAMFLASTNRHTTDTSTLVQNRSNGILIKNVRIFSQHLKVFLFTME